MIRINNKYHNSIHVSTFKNHVEKLQRYEIKRIKQRDHSLNRRESESSKSSKSSKSQKRNIIELEKSFIISKKQLEKLDDNPNEQSD